jgi:hypothetical protein
MVVIHQLAEDFYRVRAGIRKQRRLICKSRWNQSLPPCNGSRFDGVYLEQNPGKL